GFVLGQGPNALGGSLTFLAAAADESVPGTYAVTPGGLTAADYQITYAAGTLTVLGEAVLVRADVTHPGKALLLVGGSPGNDHIVITPGRQPGTLAVTINGVTRDNLA